MTKINYRNVTFEDITKIVDLGDVFFNESNFDDSEYDPLQFAYTLGYIYDDENQHILVADCDDNIVGFVIYDMVRYYTKSKISHMFLLYVHPDFRAKHVCSNLIAKASLHAKKEGCRYFYGSSSAGFSDNGRNDKVLEKIYTRQGFTDNGFFMRKDLLDE